MSRIKIHLVLASICFLCNLSIAQTRIMTSDAIIDGKIDTLLAVMTLEEKLGQLNQLSGGWNERTGERTSDEQKEMVRKGLVGSFLNIIGAEATRQVQQLAVEESRLGIPLLFGLDVIHGFRTIFPIPLAEASSWDPGLIERNARIAAIEASSAGIHWTFAPMVDIARDPRWGRIAEGSGEDPFLGSVMAAARVKGYQGSNLRTSTSILSCAKHFAAYGGAEAGRDYNTVDLSERTLREVYLPPFKAAVDAGVGSIMTAFNEIGGVPCSANRWLLTSVLRDEWGFQGFVVSDWTAIAELLPHGIAVDRPRAGLLALGAGVDMDMQSRIYVDDLSDLVRTGVVSEEVVNRAVRRVLKAKFSLGLFDDPYRNCDSLAEKENVLTPDHVRAAREAAQKSIVLLKNEVNVLPLRKDIRTIAVLGPLADSKADPLGPWHGEGRPEDVVTVIEGIKNKVSSRTTVLYAKGCEISDTSRKGFAEARSLARRADVVVLVVGESAAMSGEAASRSTLGLPGVQEELVQSIHALGKTIVLVLMNGRPLAIPWEAEHVQAIIEAWFLGIQSGNAIADVLFGDVNPSGKLPVTFPRSCGQIPIYYNHKNTGRPKSEDKFTSKYLDVPNTPLFPFGHGLSYTSFSYGNVRIDRTSIGPTDTVIASVSVKNTGDRAGDEIVQLYIRCEVASVTRPVKELIGFRRIHLEAGEGMEVEFQITPDQLSFYNQQMQRVIESGAFRVLIGPNSVDLQEARFEVLAN